MAMTFDLEIAHDNIYLNLDDVTGFARCVRSADSQHICRGL